MYEELIDLTSNFLVIFRNIAKKHAITSSQGLIMLMIDIQGISMTLLSCKLGLDASTMTRNIQRIEKKQLITRVPNLNDKRSIKLLLSSRGKSIASNLNQNMSDSVQKILDKYDFDTANQIVNNLESLGWNLYLYRQNIE